MRASDIEPLSLLPPLPEEYELECGEGGALALLREIAPALRAAGYGLHGDGALRASSLSGRRPLFELRTGAGVFLVRRLSHGGLLRFFTRARFADRSRPFRELAVSASIARMGLATPQVAAARAQPAPGWGWRLEIVTRRVEDALDLDAVLARARKGEVDRLVVRAVARAAGRLVRALHDAGCRHADLTTKNMLVEREDLAERTPEPRMWILDLDQARIAPNLSDEERQASLARLLRYVARRERLHGRALATTDWARFLRGYEPERGRRRMDARAVLAAHSRTLRWHQLGWRIEALLASRRE